MARPECTDLRARYSLLSGDHSPLWGWGHDKLESFGFWGRKFCIKNAEILSVGKIAEFAKFAGGKRRKSPDRFSLIRAAASYGWSSSVAFVERHGGRVPLSVIRVRINESRFVMRAWAFVGRESGRRLFS